MPPRDGTDRVAAASSRIEPQVTTRTRSPRPVTLTAALLVLVACTDANRERLRQPPVDPAITGGPTEGEPDHALVGCLTGDSAVYSNIRKDSTTGEDSGVRISLWLAGDAIDGATRSAGQPGRSVPIARVQLTADDSIQLDMPHDANAPDTSFFVGQVACDSLWGRLVTHRSSPPRDAAFRRLR
jgi:hypothetical protein